MLRLLPCSMVLLLLASGAGAVRAAETTASRVGATSVAMSVERVRGVGEDPAVTSRRCREEETAAASGDAGRRRQAAAASGTFKDSVTINGWGVLHVRTEQAAVGSAPLDQAFAAGCVEAKLTAQQTHDYWLNYMREEYGAEVPPPAVVKFMEHQQHWLRAQLLAEENQGDQYWEAMKLVLAQWDGFAQGIAQFATAEQRRILTPSSLYLLCSVGDLETINGMLRGDPLPTPSLELEDQLPCSALISLQTTNAAAEGSGGGGGGNGATVTDVFASQATWRSYYAMLRIYKVYAFDYYPQKVLTIASSPGLLHSKDDFLSSPTLWIAETTNMVSNSSMRRWNREHSNETALSWQRAMVASGWASSGRQWVDLFSQFNSGTYNNQWMVLDASKITVGEPLPTHDVLWIAEQVPGLVASMDVSHILASQGYWPSYNIAFIPEIYSWSGYPANRSARDGYDGAPRARIFAREAPKVDSWEKFKRLIRLNDFQNDPVCAPSGCGCARANGADAHCECDAAVQQHRSGDCAISARGDLPGPHGGAFGGIDAKVIKVSAMHAVLPPSNQPPAVEAQCGPTHDQQPAFRWSSSFPNVSHVGLPDLFDFDWVTIQ